jgi:surface protein
LYTDSATQGEVPLVGVEPDLSVSGSGNTMSCGLSDAFGVARCVLKSSDPELKEIRLSSPPDAVGNTIQVEALPTQTFRFTWEAPVNDPTLTLPLVPSGSYNIRVLWGDGESTVITDPADPARVHTYASPGSKAVSITGTFSEFRFSTNPERLLDVTYWGSQPWSSMFEMFRGCTHLTDFSANGAPNLAGTLSMGAMFEFATAFNGAVENWDVSMVNEMGRMFNGATAFNQDISNWNVSSVTDYTDFNLGGSLADAHYPFPVFVSTWKTDNTGNVLNPENNKITLPLASACSYNFKVDWGDGSAFQAITSSSDPDKTHIYAAPGTYDVRMFGDVGCLRFDADLNWSLDGDASKLIDVKFWGKNRWQSMERMFFGAKELVAFSAPDAPDLTQVSSLSGLFIDAEHFNSGIGHWETSNVRNMSWVFYNAYAYNQDLSGWNTSLVNNMDGMFFHAHAFNRPIGTWNTSSVTNMNGMFSYAGAFNQNISAWNTSSVAVMAYMFEHATLFNQNISGWDVSQVTASQNFRNASALTAPNSPFP